MRKRQLVRTKTVTQQKDEKVNKAVAEYQERDKAGDKRVSRSAIARKHGVSPSTLCRRLKEKTGSKFAQKPVNRKLDDDLSQAIVLYCQRLDFIGSPARKDMITQAARQLLAKQELTRPEFIHIGKNWTGRFLKSHPEFQVRKTTPKELKRLASTDPKIFEKYFAALGKLITEYGVDPHDIYNMDECGFRVGVR